MILEVGCGTGRWLEHLTATGATVVAVDASTGMLAYASLKRRPLALAAAKANQLPFSGKDFDIICCINALDFDDPEAFIVRAPTLLKVNGLLAIVAIDPRTIRHRYLTTTSTALGRWISDVIRHWVYLLTGCVYRVSLK